MTFSQITQCLVMLKFTIPVSTTVFHINQDQLVPALCSSSTCSGTEPLEISGTDVSWDGCLSCQPNSSVKPL